MLQNAKADTQSTRQYFQKFRTRLGRMGKYIGIHLVNEIYEDEKFRLMLANFEDGIIRMYFNECRDDLLRYIRVDSMRDGPYDNRDMEFVITQDGLNIF